jgi:hypothetical protein
MAGRKGGGSVIHDLLRTACVIAVMAVASALLIETRLHLAAIDTAQRQAVTPLAGLPTVHPQPAPASPPGRLRAVGRAILDLADAGLGVVR